MYKLRNVTLSFVIFWFAIVYMDIPSSFESCSNNLASNKCMFVSVEVKWHWMVWIKSVSSKTQLCPCCLCGLRNNWVCTNYNNYISFADVCEQQMYIGCMWLVFVKFRDKPLEVPDLDIPKKAHYYIHTIYHMFVSFVKSTFQDFHARISYISYFIEYKCIHVYVVKLSKSSMLTRNLSAWTYV